MRPVGKACGDGDGEGTASTHFPSPLTLGWHEEARWTESASAAMNFNLALLLLTHGLSAERIQLNFT